MKYSKHLSHLRLYSFLQRQLCPLYIVFNKKNPTCFITENKRKIFGSHIDLNLFRTMLLKLHLFPPTQPP